MPDDTSASVTSEPLTLSTLQRVRDHLIMQNGSTIDFTYYDEGSSAHVFESMTQLGEFTSMWFADGTVEEEVYNPMAFNPPTSHSQRRTMNMFSVKDGNDHLEFFQTTHWYRTPRERKTIRKLGAGK